MVKEVTKTVIREVTHTPPKLTRPKKSSNKPKSQITSVEKTLIENLVELQKVHTTLAERFDKLSSQISNLLTLFEVAAKSFATSPQNKANEKDKEFLDKIDKLLEQNKTIAKGLTLMEQRIRERSTDAAPEPSQVQESTPQPPQLTRLSMQNTSQTLDNVEEYQPSSTPNSRPLPRF